MTINVEEYTKYRKARRAARHDDAIAEVDLQADIDIHTEMMMSSFSDMITDMEKAAPGSIDKEASMKARATRLGIQDIVWANSPAAATAATVPQRKTTP